MSDTTVEEMEPAFAAAAEWWAEQLCGPVHWDNGDTSEQGGMTAILAMSIPSEAATNEQAEMFKKELLERLMARSYPMMFLDVDYGPEVILGEAATAAGISHARFPIKTHVYMGKNWVTAAKGYGKPHKLVWLRPGVEHPPCKRPNWTSVEEPEYKFTYLPGICGKPAWHDGEGYDNRECGEWLPAALCKCGRPESSSHWDAENGDHEYQPSGPTKP